VTAVPRLRADGEEPDADRHAPRLTIGEVLGALRDDFPDVTISKIRYLESEDLVHPRRTPSGYRKFSDADVDRLRYVLTAQRDHYLPLRVIKEHLDALDHGRPLPAAGGVGAPEPEAPPAAPVAPVLPGDDDGRRLTGPELARAAGLAPELLAECVQHGLLTPDADGLHARASVAVARAAAGLARHGIEPRHLRVHRTNAEREAGLVEQVVAPQLRARSEDARARAVEQLGELAELSAQLHSALLAVRLRDLLGG
jgi:DNA-binding transcriptional MerR regulator